MTHAKCHIVYYLQSTSANFISRIFAFAYAYECYLFLYHASALFWHLVHLYIYYYHIYSELSTLTYQMSANIAEYCSKAFIHPNVSPIQRRHQITEPLMTEFM